MNTRPPEPQLLLTPAPRLAITAWLLAPLVSLGPEGDAELRQTLLRRLQAVISSAVITFVVEILAAIRYPDLPVVWWLMLDLAVSTVRIPLVIYLMAVSRPGRPTRVLPAWTVDLFVCVGTLWSGLVGFGSALCVVTGDPGLSILSVLVVMGTIGGQGVRSPGSPRLNIIQMCLIVVPMTCGLAFSSIQLAGWMTILAPPYLFGMISITRQLHSEYGQMIVARLEQRRRAIHCPLTDLPNRALFADSLAQALRASTEEGGEVTVMYLDLDGFKAVNDTLGHAAGDDLLTQVAGRLRDMPARDAVVARLGGDEFAILLRDHAPREVEGVARDVIETLARPYEVAGTTARIGVSVGLATTATGSEAMTIMRGADEALYTAKREGRGTFRWRTRDPEPHADRSGSSSAAAA